MQLFKQIKLVLPLFWYWAKITFLFPDMPPTNRWTTTAQFTDPELADSVDKPPPRASTGSPSPVRIRRVGQPVVDFPGPRRRTTSRCSGPACRIRTPTSVVKKLHRPIIRPKMIRRFRGKMTQLLFDPRPPTSGLFLNWLNLRYFKLSLDLDVSQWPQLNHFQFAASHS